MEKLLIGIIIALILVIILLVFLLMKSNKKNNNDEIKREITNQLRLTREELSTTIGGKIVESTNIQQNSITNLTTINETKLENIRKSVEEKLQNIQKDNNDKLERMRMTVDEKLQTTLEKRLGESFKIVNDRLESVYKGLGEMQTLAQGVGDLKKVFTNVKARGYWGEVQLANILEQFLTPEQYATNVKIKAKTNDFIEFAIKLPGKNNIDTVLLPVDFCSIADARAYRKGILRPVPVTAQGCRRRQSAPPLSTPPRPPCRPTRYHRRPSPAAHREPARTNAHP